MAPFIEFVLEQVKGDLAEALAPERIEQICRELNYVWRRCTLNPVTTVYAFLRQVLAGNVACDHVPHLVDLDVTGEAYCKARLPGIFSPLSEKGSPSPAGILFSFPAGIFIPTGQTL